MTEFRKFSLPFLGVLFSSLLHFSCPSWAELPPIVGVSGMTPIEEGSYLAVWVPLPEGEIIKGVTWYNSDGSVVFPEFLAVAGEYGKPTNLDAALSFGSEFNGGTGAWSELLFPQPITSSSSGLFLIMELPSGSDFQSAGLGGGCGFGYFAGGVVNNCWITGDGITWNSLSSDYQLAMLPIFSMEKGDGALVLDIPKDGRTENAIITSDIPIIGKRMKIFPNPFNALTEISFSLTKASDVQLRVFDLRGKLVNTLVQNHLTVGDHSYSWGGQDNAGRFVSSGVYFFRLEAGGKMFTSRSMLVK